MLQACAPAAPASSPASSSKAHVAKPAHPLVFGIFAREGAARVEEATFFKKIAERPFVLVGEKHDNVEHHAFEARVVAAVGRVSPRAVAMEHFRAKDQPKLDAFFANASSRASDLPREVGWDEGWGPFGPFERIFTNALAQRMPCLLYTSDAADERSSVDLGGRRRHRSLRSGRWCARSRAAGARQGHLRQPSGAEANSLGHSRQALFAAVRFMPHRYARYCEGAGTYSERSDARGTTGSRVPAFRCPSGLAGGALQSHSRPCRALAARDRAHHRPERSDRCLRQPPHAALVLKVLSWLTFFAPAKKVSRPRGRNPRLQCKPTDGRRTAHRKPRQACSMQAWQGGPASC